MASAWGDSWGDAWGDSWGTRATAAVAPAKSDDRRGKIIKPTGLVDRPKLKLKAKDKRVQERLEDSAKIQAEVAAELAQELGTELPPVRTMSQAQIDAEIRTLLHRKIRTENEEIMLLLLLAASA